MKKGARIAIYAVAGIALLGTTAFGTTYGVSGSKLGKRHDLPQIGIAASTDPFVIERGRHLVTAVGNCVECHGEDLGGRVFMDAPPALVSASNLTAGRGGIGATYSDGDYARAIRHGIRPDGTSLIIMPSESFTYFNDGDLTAIISYLRTVAPVDRELPPTKVRPLGRFLLGAGLMPMLAAELTPSVTTRASVTPAPTAEYGAYLAEVGGCRACHNPDLSGGKVIAPGTPPSANLTPAGIGSWTEADFVRALREGKRPDGSAINEIMPWRFAGRMTDDELHALWLYLQTVPAKETAAK